MGVTGLTSYMNSNSLVYFDKISLNNCPLVIDGNSLAANIAAPISYMMTFGGDYDIIGYKIEQIFKLFASCGIVPIVIFDGAMDKKKYKTILNRVRQRVKVYRKIKPGSRQPEFMPLLLRIAVREKLKSLGVTMLQSDMEADREIAAVAKKLNAPVLSNDSDFFIYDVPYIPFDTFSTKKIDNGIKCSIFYPEKFLQISHINKDVVPLLSVLSGNDYTQCFSEFTKRLPGTDMPNFMSKAQKKIQRILNFLESETYQSAVNKILSGFRHTETKEKMKKTITKIVESYTNFDTILINYIPDSILHRLKSSKKYGKSLLTSFSNMKISEETDEPDTQEFSTDECDEEDFENDEEIDTDNESEIVFRQSVPDWVFEQSRVGNFHPDMLTLINLKMFLADPQIEDYSLPGSCIVALPIINNLAGILLNDEEFIFWNRQNSDDYKSSIIKISNQQLKLESINQLSISRKRKFFFILYGVNNDFFQAFPEEWFLLLCALIFWANTPNSSATQYHIHSLLLMLVAVEVMERKIGRYWSNFFMKIPYHKNKIESLRPKAKENNKTNISVKQAFKKINNNECYLMVEHLFPYFKTHKPIKSFNGSELVHPFSQFQNCLFSTILLNQILGFPFQCPNISKFYNSTFLYNMALQLKPMNEYVNFISNLFNSQGSVSLTNLYLSLVKNLEAYLPQKSQKEETQTK